MLKTLWNTARPHSVVVFAAILAACAGGDTPSGTPTPGNGASVLPPVQAPGTVPAAGAPAAAGSTAVGAAGSPVVAQPMAGSTAVGMGTAGMAGMAAPGAGSGGATAMMPPMTRPDAGTMPTTPDAGTMTGEPGMSVSGVPDAELTMLRQVCLDEINMYRGTLMMGPLMAATAEQGLCSDQGAKKDGDSGRAHGSAGGGNPCNTTMKWGAFPYFSAQNTCPGYPVRAGGTIADALKGCLKQMWAEGEPPEGEAQCMAEYRMGDTACFLAHGHFLNMRGKSKGVSCGFYKMQNGRYWMNQDFF